MIMDTQERLKEEFRKFVQFVREKEASGVIKYSPPTEITDYDLAVTFAIGLIQDLKGVKCVTTATEIWQMMTIFAPDLAMESE